MRNILLLKQRWAALVVALLLGVTVSACGGSAPADASDKPDVLESREGLASFYGKALHGEETASGRTFDMNAMVAAHPTYPFGTRVRVTNLENDREAAIRIIDRGPVDEAQREGVIIDLSRGVARELGFVEDGRVRVRVEVLEWGADEAK